VVCLVLRLHLHTKAFSIDTSCKYMFIYLRSSPADIEVGLAIGVPVSQLVLVSLGKLGVDDK
jgi:hypothetical protein